jgi:hypothetical protein
MEEIIDLDKITKIQEDKIRTKIKQLKQTIPLISDKKLIEVLKRAGNNNKFLEALKDKNSLESSKFKILSDEFRKRDKSSGLMNKVIKDEVGEVIKNKFSKLTGVIIGTLTVGKLLLMLSLILTGFFLSKQSKELKQSKNSKRSNNVNKFTKIN